MFVRTVEVCICRLRRRTIASAARDSVLLSRHIQNVTSLQHDSYTRSLTLTPIALDKSKKKKKIHKFVPWENALQTPMEATTSIPNETPADPKSRPLQRKKAEHGQKQQGGSKHGGAANQKPGAKLRGLEKDSPEVRVSKTLSWLLRHGAKGEGLAMRPDGYVKATDLVCFFSFLTFYQATLIRRGCVVFCSWRTLNLNRRIWNSQACRTS
jgi:hypothetical protein